MTSERAKELLPIIQAFAEGKSVEIRDKGSKIWVEVHNPHFTHVYDYRIKPEDYDYDHKYCHSCNSRDISTPNLQCDFCENGNHWEPIKPNPEYLSKDKGHCHNCNSRHTGIKCEDCTGITMWDPIETLSHADILRMWWWNKDSNCGWAKVSFYIRKSKKYRIHNSFYAGNEDFTAEELFKNWEYTEIPPE
jgi:hypothetical protein